MREYLVSSDERGQRLDKYLKRLLPSAPSSFLYKMLRKKNITLAGKKADGSEKVEEGDRVVLYLSEETIGKFSAPPEGRRAGGEEACDRTARQALLSLAGRDPVLYEDGDILAVTKPQGVLSQKADPSDLSMNEWLRAYLQEKTRTQEEADGWCRTPGFRPSVCNRLDRNTGGILLCAKSLQGSRVLSEAIRERRITKTYRMVVHGSLSGSGILEGDLIKDRKTNQVTAAPAQASGGPDGSHLVRRRAVTKYRAVMTGRHASLIEADLITGRSHQLRVHMASIGHPIVFDPRYGDRDLDRLLAKKLGRIRGEGPGRGQLLWCVRVSFPDKTEGDPLPGTREGAGSGSPQSHELVKRLAGKSFTSPEPGWWKKLCSV